MSKKQPEATREWTPMAKGDHPQPVEVAQEQKLSLTTLLVTVGGDEPFDIKIPTEQYEALAKRFGSGQRAIATIIGNYIQQHNIGQRP